MAQSEPPKKPLYLAYEAAVALKSRGINCCLWCEDLLWQFKARHVAIDRFFLVADPESAAQALEQLGFCRLAPSPRFGRLSELLRDSVRLSHPSDKDLHSTEPDIPAAVLLSAENWHFPITQLDEMTDILPPVHVIVSSLIDTWLDAETISFQLLLRLYLATIDECVEHTREAHFASQLEFEYQREIWRAVYEDSIIGERIPGWLKQRQAEREQRRVEDGSTTPPYNA